MAISEVDLILIDKQIKGTLTAKEHAMWSRRMQDRDFIRAWHAAHDDFLQTLLEEMKEKEAQEEQLATEKNSDLKAFLWEQGPTIILFILLALILVGFIIFMALPELWVEDMQQ